MKKRVAIVRGPNLNSWEMQNFSPLLNSFNIVGFTSYGHNFDVRAIPFEVRKLFSVGQFVRVRLLRKLMFHFIGDYHDLQGLGKALAGFDIVHSAETSYYCTYQAARVKRELGFKLVVTVWENIPFLHHSPAIKKNKEEIFQAADLFLPVSERAKEALILEGVPVEKIRVQMPGIDTRHFRPMPKDPNLLQKFNLKNGDVVVLFVGNLHREKGVFDLIYAFRRVMNRLNASPSMKLLIAGSGRERVAVQRMIRELRLESSAHLIGSFPYSEMPDIHNIADIFVLPSVPTPAWQEQFGYVLIESMACGKPVISTSSGSIPEVMGSSGILVPPNDFMSLADELEHLLIDHTARTQLGLQARIRAEKTFDVKTVAMQFKRHYDSVFGD